MKTTKKLDDNFSLSTETKPYQMVYPKDIKMVFENLLPPHSDEEVEQLERNILNDGEIRDPLVIWNNGNANILVDGFIRHQIAVKHNLKCPIIFYDFKSEKEVRTFILTNQLGRRNLTDFCKCELVLQLGDYFKPFGRVNQSMGGKGCQIKDEDRIDAKKILGEKAGVSHDTFAKAKKISKEVKDSEVLNELRKGDRSISNVYNELTGKKPKTEPIPKQLFDGLGSFIPELSSLKSLTIIPTKDGLYRIEVITKQNEKQVCETVNQIVITESKPLKPDTDEKLLHLLYDVYDFDTISNPYWEDLRSLFIRDVRKIFKYVSLKMDEKSDFRLFCEKLRLEIEKNWKEKNQPIGGGMKNEDQIISELKIFKDLDPLSFLIADDSGKKNVLVTDIKLTSGIKQYFPEMLNTPTQTGKSPMDVIKDPKKFLKFIERIIVSDGKHLFTKSLEHKNKLKKDRI